MAEGQILLLRTGDHDIGCEGKYVDQTISGVLKKTLEMAENTQYKLETRPSKTFQETSSLIEESEATLEDNELELGRMDFSLFFLTPVLLSLLNFGGFFNPDIYRPSSGGFVVISSPGSLRRFRIHDFDMSREDFLLFHLHAFFVIFLWSLI